MMRDATNTVPRYFALRAVGQAAAAVAVIFAVVSLIQAELRVVAPILWFMLCVCTAQIVFHHVPPLFSTAVGAIAFPISAAIDPLFDGKLRWQNISTVDLAWLTVGGTVAGYLAGVLLAESFQVADLWQRERKQQAYAVPRRFGMSTILIATTVFAVIFAIMEYARARPWQLFFFTSFVATVAVSQAVVNHNPRWASILAGGIFLPVSYALFGSLGRRLELPRLRFNDPRELLLQLATFAAVGLLIGYLGGTLIAGVFLVSDYLARTILPTRRLPSPLPQAREEDALPGGTLSLLAERAAANRRQG